MAEKGITQIKGGVLARHYWGKAQPLQEYFMDKDFGSHEKAEAAAGRWLAAMREAYPAPEEKGRKPIMGTIKDSHGEHGAGFYVSWTEEGGRQRQKTFPISQWGSTEKAKAAALHFLDERTKEYEGRQQ